MLHFFLCAGKEMQLALKGLLPAGEPAQQQARYAPLASKTAHADSQVKAWNKKHLWKHRAFLPLQAPRALFSEPL